MFGGRPMSSRYATLKGTGHFYSSLSQGLTFPLKIPSFIANKVVYRLLMQEAISAYNAHRT